MILKELQRKVYEWSVKNFAEEDSYLPLLGALEELGELSHAHVKGIHGIKYSQQKVKDLKKDAIGDTVLCLLNYCEREGIDLEEALLDSWKVVSQRDWKKNPTTGKADPEYNKASTAWHTYDH